MEDAAAADPRNADYQVALAYVCLAAGKYQRATEATGKALELGRDDPLIHLLRGQAEGAIAQMDPEKAGERIGPALSAFDCAAQRAAENALPLLQGASVALDVEREDLAFSRLKQALDRPRFTLYQLPIPWDVVPDREAARQLWQRVQLGQWVELLARCQNVSRALLRLGEQEHQSGDLDAAESRFQEALAVARAVGSAEPSLFITTNAAIDMMENAYGHLLAVAEEKGSHEAQRWRGELGVLQIARADLLVSLQRYLERLDEQPPESLAELLRFEAESVEPAVLGIGLTPPTTMSNSAPGSGESSHPTDS
jgi:tetratricopeptide (TPR) repeat protein